MTNLEIFQQVLHLIRQYATATLYPAEFDVLWNKELMDYVSLRASEDEKDEKRNQDLQWLKCVDVIANSGSATTGGEIFALPYSPGFVNTPGNPVGNNFGFYRMENASVAGTYISCGTNKSLSYFPMTPWIKDDEKHVIQNPFRTPVVDDVTKEIQYEERNFKLYIHASNLIAGTVKIEYLRYPVFMDVTNNPSAVSEYPVYVIDEIKSRIDSAYKARNGSPLYPASIQQQKSTVN
jgi:hypothetical protein